MTQDESWDQMKARHTRERHEAMRRLLTQGYPKGLEHSPIDVSDDSSIQSINDLVAHRHKVEAELLRGKNRDWGICSIRHEAWAIQREVGHSLSKIGRWYSGRDYTTVLSGIKRHEGARASQ